MTKIFGRVKADTVAYYQLRKLISSRICHSPWVWWYPTFRRIVAPSSSSTSSPWKWIQYDPSKRQKLHTRRPSVTCQRTWVFRSTAVRTSDVALSVPSTKRHDKFCSIDKLCLQTKWHYCFSWLASFLAKLYPYLHILTILGAFAYLRKKKSLLPLSRLSICPWASARLPLDGFPWNLISGTFMKSVDQIQIWLKSGTLHGDLISFIAPATLNPQTSAVFKQYGVRLLGQHRKYEHSPKCVTLYVRCLSWVFCTV